MKHGKAVAGLEAAMLEPAKERLATAVAMRTIAEAQADRRLARLEAPVHRLVTRTFDAKARS